MGLRNRHTQPVYYNELYDIEDFIGTSCLNNDDLHAPTFLWDSSICEESRDDDAEPSGHAGGAHGRSGDGDDAVDAMVFRLARRHCAGAQRTGDGIEMPASRYAHLPH